MLSYVYCENKISDPHRAISLISDFEAVFIYHYDSARNFGMIEFSITRVQRSTEAF